MIVLLLLFVVSGVWLGSAALWSDEAARAKRDSFVCLRLQFHRSLSHEQVEAFLGSLTGLLPPRWRRWLDTTPVVFEVETTKDGFEHRLLVPEARLGIVENALRTHLPNVRFEQVETPANSVTSASEYRVSASHRTLRVHDGTVSAQMLNAMWPLAKGERVTLQWIVTPAAPPAMPRVATDRDNNALWPFRNTSGVMSSAADVASMKEKLRTPGLLAVARIGAEAADRERAQGLVHRVESSMYSTTAPGVQVRRRQLREGGIARRLQDRQAPFSDWPMPLNATELAGMLGWPTGEVTVPGLRLSGCRPLPIAPPIPSVGTVIGDGFTMGVARPAALDQEARFRHVLLVGGTGVGKTTLQINMALADAEEGRGELIIDPKGADLIDGVMERLPEKDWDRVVVLDPADATRPVGIDPLRPRGVPPELAVEHLVGLLHRVFSASWGVRSDDIWRASLRTLVADPDATLVDLGTLLTDAAARRKMVSRVTDPVLAGFWKNFNAMSDAEASQHVSPVLNKWRAIFSRPSLRRTFGQANPGFDLSEHLDNGGIVLVPLNAGLMGEDAVALFGALLLGSLWNLVQSRANRPPSERHPIAVHLDEFPRYAALPVPFEELLAQARSYRVGITLSCQHLHQIETDLRHAVLSNPRSRIAFQVSQTDARTLAQEFGNGLTGDDFRDLDPYQVAAQLHAGGRTQPACTLTTRMTPDPTGSSATVREMSRQRFGADGEEVDRILTERLESLAGRRDENPDAPTGRKRRES